MDIKLVGGGGFDCNHYLIRTPSEAIVVDAGSGVGVADTIERVREHAQDVPVSRIYLTHWHHDHVGGAPALARALDADLVMPEAEAIAVREGRADLTLGRSFGAEQEAHPVTGVEPGDTLAVGDEVFEVLHTPGHTAGHTSLWHPASRTLLAGDVVFSHGSFGRVDLPTGDAKAMIETLERLVDLDVHALFPGHIDLVREQAHKHIELALSNARGMLQ